MDSEAFLREERRSSHIMMLLFRAAGALGLASSIVLTVNAINSDEGMVPDLLTGAAVLVATATLIPAERYARNTFNNHDDQLQAMDNRGEV